MYHTPRFRFSISFILVAVLFFVSHSIFAQEASQAQLPTAAQLEALQQQMDSQNTASGDKKGVVVLADVNVYDARIIEQSGSSFKIGFDLSNGVGSQTGIKYAIRLFSVAKDGKQTLADEKVYEEEVSLPQNSTITKEIVYTAPSNLNGSYTMMIFVNNVNGFPLGLGSLGKTSLVSKNTGIEILANSCYLTVVGEKGSPRYHLSQGVDIGTEETLSLTCTAVNSSKTSFSSTPIYETTALSAFGDKVETRGGDLTAIAFKPLEKKTFSLKLPQALSPKMYSVKVSLLSGATVSNTVNVAYALRGLSASIQNASLDKDQYKKGDQATLSVIWSSRVGGVRLSASAMNSSILAETKMTDVAGANCVDTTVSPLIYEANSPVSKVSLPVKNSCRDPKVEITLLGAQQQKLDTKTFAFKTLTPAQEALALEEKNPKGNIRIALIILGVLCVLALVAVYLKKRQKVEDMNKVDGTPNLDIAPTVKKKTINKILPVIFFVLCSLALPQDNIDAKTVYIGDSNSGSLTGVFNLNQSSYLPGQAGTISVSVYGATFPMFRDYVGVDASFYMLPYFSRAYLVSAESTYPIESQDGMNNWYGGGSFTAPSSAGNYSLGLSLSGTVYATDEVNGGSVSHNLAGDSTMDLTVASRGARLELSPYVDNGNPRNGASSTSAINPGETTYLLWNVENATSCTYNGVTYGGVRRDLTINPKIPLSPSQTTTYSVTCSN